MKFKFVALISLLILMSLLLSGCSGGALAANSWPGLAADSNMAYLAGGQFVYAVRLDNGNEAWRYPEKADNKKTFFAAPVLTADGQMIIGSGGSDHSLISLDVTGGTPGVNWTFSGAEDRWVGSPLVLNETIYAPNGDGRLYALDLKGNLLWTLKLGGPLWTTPATDGSLVYVPSLDHYIYAVDPKTESVAWKVEAGGAVMGTPALSSDGKLYVGSFASKLEVIDPAKQSASDLVTTEGWIWGGPVFDGDTLYFGDLEGNFYSVNAADGKENWAPIKPDGPIVGSPLVTSDGMIVSTESGNIVTISTDGKSRNQTVGGKIYSAPLAAGDLILVAPMQAESLLVALDLQGRQVWTFTPSK
jgi:outer membrane protein assembly factor BamB